MLSIRKPPRYVIYYLIISTFISPCIVSWEWNLRIGRDAEDNIMPMLFWTNDHQHCTHYYSANIINKLINHLSNCWQFQPNCDANAWTKNPKVEWNANWIHEFRICTNMQEPQYYQKLYDTVQVCSGFIWIYNFFSCQQTKCYCASLLVFLIYFLQSTGKGKCKLYT